MKWEKISNKANIWDFELNAELEGTYAGMKENVGKNNARLYFIKKTSGEEASFWGGTILDDLMVSVPIDSSVRIRYLGKAKSKNSDREYKNFEIELGKEDLDKEDF